jgi:hypothetical protein
VRDWQFPTLAKSSFPTTNISGERVYGVPKIYKRAVNAYFGNRPYQHRINRTSTGATGYVTAIDGRAMLAPITRVGDNSSRGADNGLYDSKEVLATDSFLLGDTFMTGFFGRAFDPPEKTTPSNMSLSVMDATNDGCVELPFVTDPTGSDLDGDPLSTRCAATGPKTQYPHASKQQVARFLATHELGHAVGVTSETALSGDTMYRYSINWTRDLWLSPEAAGYITITNGGKP